MYLHGCKLFLDYHLLHHSFQQSSTTKIHFCAFARVGEYIASLAKNGIQQIDKNVFR